MDPLTRRFVVAVRWGPYARLPAFVRDEAAAGRWTAEVAVRVCRQACDALAPLHQEGFAHGEVCAANVWVQAAPMRVMLAGTGTCCGEVTADGPRVQLTPRADCAGIFALLVRGVAAASRPVAELTDDFWTAAVDMRTLPPAMLHRIDRLPSSFGYAGELLALNARSMVDPLIGLETAAAVEAQVEAALVDVRTAVERYGRLIAEAERARARDAVATVSIEIPADAIVFERTRRGDRVRIGKGSFGDVYAATFFGQPCAIKVPNLHSGPTLVPPELQAAFWAEVRVHAALRHPHIVVMHGGYADVDPAAGGVVEVGAVTERCSGGTLEDRLHGGYGGAGAAPGTLKQRFTWAAQVLSALAYLHARDIIHADLKPENVLLEDGSPGARAKLTDFGLAKQRADAASTHASHLGVRGSYPYMDPALLAWDSSGGAAAPSDGAGGVVASSIRKPCDVYSAGVMLWELATGRRPYADALGGGDIRDVTLPQLLAHVMGGGRPATQEQLAALEPPGIGALIGRMWAARAEDRPLMREAVWTLGSLMPEAGDEASGHGGADEAVGRSYLWSSALVGTVGGPVGFTDSGRPTTPSRPTTPPDAGPAAGGAPPTAPAAFVGDAFSLTASMLRSLGHDRGHLAPPPATAGDLLASVTRTGDLPAAREAASGAPDADTGTATAPAAGGAGRA
jgi:serine/threonine protein kinase